MHTLQVAAVIAPLLGLGAASSRYSTPNATRSVNFKPFSNDDTEWTWSVNVTDSHTDPNVLHYVEIAYDFSWPGDGSLDSTPGAAKNPNGTFCVVVPTTWGTAKNITDKYTDANTHSTDCTPVLGSACVDAILTASAENDDGSRYGCLHGWSKYPECADTFGIAEYAPYQKQGLELQVNSLSSWYSRSGETFYAFTEGGVLPDTNSPGLYESAVNMLQVVLLRPPVAGPGERPSPTLNCMRVNTKEVVDGGSGSEDGNSGASRHVAAGGLWAVMGSLAVALL